MSYILAATDFSPVSINAINYAAAVAQQHQMQLVLLHSFVFPAMVNDVTIPASLIDETRRDAQTRMDELADNLRNKWSGMDIKQSVMYGSFTDAASGYAESAGAPWLMVIGNSNTQEDTAWFFSTLKNVSRNMEHPLLAVPMEATYKSIEKICYADDIEQQENSHMLNMLKDITLRCGAELHVLNVQQDASLHDDAYDAGEITKEILGDAKAKYHYRHLANVDDSIREFCNDEQIDWLAMVPGKYSFLEGLFHSSHTKALAKTLSIPLLILH